MNTNKYKCESIRLCRYLYGLGFDKISIFENGKESWLFEKSGELQEALDFFFIMRKKLKSQNTGANELCVQDGHMKKKHF